MLAVTAFATPLVLFVLGPSYAASASVLKILVWATVPSFLGCASLTFLLAKGKERPLIWMTASCMAFNIVANVLLIPRFSYHAAAAVTVLTELLLLAQNLYVVRRSFKQLVLPRHGLSMTLAFAAAFGGFWILQSAVHETIAGGAALAAFALYAVWINWDIVRMPQKIAA